MRLIRPSVLLLPLLTAALAAASILAPDARLLPISDHAYAGSSVNVMASSRSTLVTHGTTQFAAFYDADSFLVLAKRTLGTDVWLTHRTEQRGRVADAHNFISLAVDGDGFLHVAWDHHNAPLHYARSREPLGLELAAPATMTGERETRVTYPQFHRLPDGDLLFLYRDGTSGDGSLVLNRYATASGKWSVIQPDLISGEGLRSPYWDLRVGANGTLHLAWTWRETPDVATNHDLGYAASSDGGATWHNAGQTRLALPITTASDAYAWRIPTRSNLMNPPVVEADGQGNPYLSSYWSPMEGALPRFQIVRHDGQGWSVIEGPASSQAFTLSGGGTKRPPISRPVLLVRGPTRAPSLQLLYRDDARGGHLVLASRSGVAPERDWELRDLNNESLGGGEPSIDPDLWRRFGQVHLLVEPVAQHDGNDSTGAAATPATISSLIWSPVSARMRHAVPAGAANEDQSVERPLDASAIRALAQRVADWQWANLPPNSVRHPREWIIAPFYLGVLALDRIAPDHPNRERMLAQAEAIQWQPDERFYHADSHCVIQVYLELHAHHRQPRMLAPSRTRFDAILARPAPGLFDWGTPHCTDHWSWCDALFMAPVSWLQMWQATGDRRYLDFMNREWWRTTERLYRPAAGFYFRDESFLDLREPNGKTLHWARGNGWAFAGLARVLALFPHDHPDYPRYVRLYREMSRAVLGAQQSDGLWRIGLLDPAAHPERETSGSAFYVFGLAWGVNHGLLDRAAVEPAVRRGWHALAACVTADGKLEHVQPVGASPERFDPHHTAPFGVGAFLLAASEVHPLAQPGDGR